MAPARTDPLLRLTRLLLLATMIPAGIAFLAGPVGIPVIWLARTNVNINGAVATPEILAAISFILACISAVAVAALVFLRKLVAIIDSVKQGSPFIPENAARLRTMAWLVLVFDGLLMISAPAEAWLKHVLHDTDVELDLSFSFGWLVTALLLFILARVFDQGTRLAEDVEGTV